VKVLDIPLALHLGEKLAVAGWQRSGGGGTRFDGSTLLFGRLADEPDSRGM
jgi:hypothetical protein